MRAKPGLLAGAILAAIVLNIVFLSRSLKTAFPNPLKRELADLDNNTFPETYVLKNGRLTIRENSKLVWQSASDWRIDNFILADSTNDGIVDINLSVWKAGNFGSSKPFWIKENDQSVKNHFFIFNFKNGVVSPIWQSSNLESPNQALAVGDIDDDNRNELVVIEGSYAKKDVCKENFVAVWRWNGWGFSNEWRSEKGNFCSLKIEKVEGRSYIMVESF